MSNLKEKLDESKLILNLPLKNYISKPNILKYKGNPVLKKLNKYNLEFD